MFGRSDLRYFGMHTSGFSTPTTSPEVLPEDPRAGGAIPELFSSRFSARFTTSFAGGASSSCMAWWQLALARLPLCGGGVYLYSAAGRSGWGVYAVFVVMDLLWRGGSMVAALTGRCGWRSAYVEGRPRALLWHEFARQRGARAVWNGVREPKPKKCRLGPEVWSGAVLRCCRTP